MGTMEINPSIQRPILWYYGGKWNLAPWVISFFAHHDDYVEPCGGAASVLLRKPPSKLETYNDLDGHVCNFFRVLRDNPGELERVLMLTPWARDEFEACKTPSEDPLEDARRFFMTCFMSISKMSFNQASGFRTASYSMKCPLPSTEITGIKRMIPIVAERLRHVQIENRPYEYIVERYDNEKALIYFDPPYVGSERTQKDQYHHEFTNEKHIEASEILKQCKGFVVISGYVCPLYTNLYEEEGWTRYDSKPMQTNSGGLRIESVWLNQRAEEAYKRAGQLKLFDGTPSGTREG